jgi:F-type H+-transporting ATPase subunit b
MKKFFRLFLAFIFIVVFATVLFAAEAHGEHDLKRQLWDFIWRIINFGILVFLLYKVGKKPFKEFLYSRKEKIETAIIEAENAKRLAEDRKKEYEEKLKNLEQEKQQILEQFKKEGEAEKARIIALAESKAEKIIEQAKVSAEQELEKEKEKIKRETTEAIIKMAEEIIKKNITSKDHNRIINNSIERMVSIN